MQQFKAITVLSNSCAAGKNLITTDLLLETETRILKAAGSVNLECLAEYEHVQTTKLFFAT